MTSCRGQHTKRNRKRTCQEAEAVTRTPDRGLARSHCYMHHRDVPVVSTCILIVCQAYVSFVVLRVCVAEDFTSYCGVARSAPRSSEKCSRRFSLV